MEPTACSVGSLSSVTRRQLTLFLVPLGVVIAHIAAYVLPHPENGTGSHHHLAGLALVGVGAAALAVGSAVVGAARGRHVAVSGPGLAAVQSAAYVVLELAEALASGSSLGQALSAPTLRTGIVLQLVVATLLRLLLRASIAVGRWLARPSGLRREVDRTHRIVRRDAAPARRLPSPVTRRGPPLVVTY